MNGIHSGGAFRNGFPSVSSGSKESYMSYDIPAAILSKYHTNAPGEVFFTANGTEYFEVRCYTAQYLTASFTLGSNVLADASRPLRVCAYGVISTGGSTNTHTFKLYARSNQNTDLMTGFSWWAQNNITCTFSSMTGNRVRICDEGFQNLTPSNRDISNTPPKNIHFQFRREDGNSDSPCIFGLHIDYPIIIP